MGKTIKRMMSILLSMTIVLSCISISATALNDFYSDSIESSLSTALNYINALTLNNNSNVPSTIVTKFGNQFTWDNEKRESANKSYLFEWSYYNGVVFEGLEYIYDYTKDPSYRNYVEAYMSAMIASNGTWAKTTNNTSKDCAGYVNNHGADCYKTASLLLDMAKDANGNVNTQSKYYKMATTLYNDLTTGVGSGYSKQELGYNYWHSNWNSQTAPTYKVWLDGIYMIQPFMAEYAYYKNDTAQMSKILSRFQWLYNNGRNPSTGLYYHAVNSASSVCNFHWTRAIGWYAMAVVDVMQYMSGSNLDAMKVILKDLVDNMLPYQNANNGMWANITNNAVTSTNRLETSGTAMMAYAIAKGVNNGWIDSSYGQYAKAAFDGMVENKLSGNNLSDIYFKASASGSNNYETTSNYLTNEGKGVGPFIMAYAQVRELYENESRITDLIHQPTGIIVKNTTATAISVSDITNDINIFSGRRYIVYDISLTDYNQTEVAEIHIPAPQEANESNSAVYCIDNNNNVSKVENVQFVDGVYVFQSNRMGKYAIVEHISEDEANWVQVGNGYYTLTGNTTPAFVVGTAFDISKIAAETNIRYKADELTDSSAVSWTDPSVSYTWTPSLDMSTIGTYTMNVKINNTSIGTVTVYVGEDDYPIFPNEGSVVIDKWANPDQLRNVGVTEVNLSAKGIPSPKPVDVLFVTDVSNSMYWVAGTTTNATASQSSKLNDMQRAVADFTEILFSGNAPGNERNNTISFVTFGGLDKQHEQNTANVKNWSTYADPTRTLFTSAETVSAVTTPVNNIRYSAVDNTVFITFDGSDGSANTSTDVSYGGTNYDYGFMEAASAITQIKQNYYNKTGNVYDNSERSIYVVFITDGAPTHYNGTMYRHDTETTRPDKNETWINANGQEVVYVNGYNNGSANYTQAQWYSYITSTRSHWATQVYNTPKVADMLALGIDMANGGFASWVFTEASGYPLKNFVEKIVTNKTLETHFADNSTQLASELLNIANAINTSSNDAYTIDTMGPMVDLQMANTVNCGIAEGGTLSLSEYGITPTIKVKSYDCYSIKEVGTVVNGVTVTREMVGTHKNENATIQETVTFNAAGTQAYSDKLSGNIMANGVITASKFIYNSNSTPVTLPDGTVLPAESFKWLLDSIAEDETVLSYYVYLTGSMEGERPGGTYTTNESAILYYNNYLGHDCQLVYPVPQISWDEAKVTYQLYLVDQYGNPINNNGHIVPFANRTIVSALVELEKYLNTATVIDYETLQSIIPEGYYIYNENASYSGKISSNDRLNGAVINDTTGTTKIFFPTGTSVNTDGTVTGLEGYTDIRVTFAVYKYGINPDAIVVDYGKPVTIDPLANDNGEFVINGILSTGATPGTNTEDEITLTSGVATVERSTVNDEITVPTGNLVTTPFALSGTVYVYPELGTTSDQNNTAEFRYKVESDGKVTKYAKNSTSGTVLATLTSGNYVIDDNTYAIYRSDNNYISIATGYRENQSEEQRETTIQTPVSYYRFTDSNVSLASNIQVKATRSNSRTTMFTLPNGHVISAYYQSNGWRNPTYTLYFFDNSTGSSVVTMINTSNSASFKYTATGLKDNNGNDLQITVNLSRTATNSRSINATYTGYELYNGYETTTTTETVTVYSLQTKQYYERDKVRFSLFSYLSSIETFYYYVSPKSNPARNSDSASASLQSAKVQVIPATTVYYEDDFGGSQENGGLYIQYTGNWYKVSDDSTSSNGLSSNTDQSDRQDDGEIGVGNTPYGYDSSYDDDNKFSNGSAARVEGSMSIGENGPQFDATASFEFTGTGFDIISRTDLDCGMVTVYITDEEGNFIDNVPVINKGTNTLYQIPVISYTAEKYGTYKVTINVNAPIAILGITGSTFYLDAIRIYNPLGVTDNPGEDGDETLKTAYDAYNADKEANAYVASIRDFIVQAKDLDITKQFGAVYVDTINNDYSGAGTLNPGDYEDQGEPDPDAPGRDLFAYRTLNQSLIKDFELIGPNEEVYLSPGYGVGFEIEATKRPVSVQLEMKVPTPLTDKVATLLAQTYGQPVDPQKDAITVSSATEMFYDITNNVIFEEQADGTFKSTVILSNNIGGSNVGEIVSVTNIKLTYADDTIAVNSTDDQMFIYETDENLVYTSIQSSWNTYEEAFDTVYVQRMASVPDYDITSSKSEKTVATGGEAVATLKTSRYVDELVIKDSDGNVVTPLSVNCETDENKFFTQDFEEAKVWTVAFNAYGEDGTISYTAESAEGNGKIGTFDVTIKNPKVTSIKVNKLPNKVNYKLEEEFNDDGMEILVTYDDGTTKVVNTGFTTEAEDFTKSGTYTIKVNYGDHQTTFDVKAKASVIQIIERILKIIMIFLNLK